MVPLACAAVFLGLFLVLPMEIGLWWYVYPREATAAAFLLLGAFPDLPRSILLRAPLTAALAVGGLGVSSVVAKNYAVFGRATDDFAAIATLAPSRAARNAIARPMPREAPVMNRVSPDSVVMAGFPLW